MNVWKILCALVLWEGRGEVSQENLGDAIKWGNNVKFLAPHSTVIDVEITSYYQSIWLKIFFTIQMYEQYSEWCFWQHSIHRHSELSSCFMMRVFSLVTHEQIYCTTNNANLLSALTSSTTVVWIMGFFGTLVFTAMIHLKCFRCLLNSAYVPSLLSWSSIFS